MEKYHNTQHSYRFAKIQNVHTRGTNRWVPDEGMMKAATRRSIKIVNLLAILVRSGVDQQEIL
jgi:hypothetical protein